jgi:ferredoxin
MALKITDDCINCGSCEIECPYGAVYPAGTNWRMIDNKYFRFCEDTKHYDEYFSKMHYYIVPEKMYRMYRYL